MSKPSRRQKQKLANNTGGIFGQPGATGRGGKGSGGGWGLGEPGGKPASGQMPMANPWLMPKQAGVNIFTNTFASNYWVEWNTSTWRAVCDQAINQGNLVGLAALYSWVAQKSTFIKGLFRKTGIGLDRIRFYCEDSKGNQMDEWTIELCNKPWQRQLRREIMWGDIWGVSGLNFDPRKEKLYKYPMQQIDPINRMLRAGTYDYANGVFFDDAANLLLVQPSQSIDSALGLMQSITHDFIQMNVTDNNWVAAGLRLAFPLLGVGYPQNDGGLDPTTQEAVNPYKIAAEDLAENIDPTKGIAFPYTIDSKGNIQRSILLEFEKPGTAANQHLIFKDFDEKKKIEIQEAVFGRSLSNSSGKGNRALGEVEQEAIDEYSMASAESVLEYLNLEVLPKLKRFYKNFPDDIKYSIDRSKIYTMDEIVKLSEVLNQSGKRFTLKFFEDQGLSKDYIEESPEPASSSGPNEDISVQMAGPKKKF